MYGHIHVAKTGGTTLNLLMANKYDNVCGHKGYSYDFVQANRRSKIYPGQADDLYHKKYNDYDRTRVPLSIMDEIGYEDCHWLSNEVPFAWWRRFEKWHEPVELHLPCRDPIEHLLSQRNFKNLPDINCATFSERNVDESIVNSNRFDSDIAKTFKNISISCISFENQFDGTYDKSLNMVRRRYSEHLHTLSTNKKRSNESCINTDLQLNRRIRKYMITRFSYYNFCHTCKNWIPDKHKHDTFGQTHARPVQGANS